MVTRARAAFGIAAVPFRAAVPVSGLRRSLRKNRQQKTAWIGDLERTALPLRVVRFRRERDAGVPGPLGNLVDVTRRRLDGQPHADSLLAVASLLPVRSEEHTSELQSRLHLVCRLLLE